MIYEMAQHLIDTRDFLTGKKDYEALEKYLDPIPNLIEMAKYLEVSSGRHVVEERIVEVGNNEYTLTVGFCFRRWVENEDYVEIDAAEYDGDEVLVTWRVDADHTAKDDNDAEIIVNVKLDGDSKEDLRWRVMIAGQKLRGKPNGVEINFGFVGGVEEIRKGESLVSVLARACIDQVKPALKTWSKGFKSR